MKKRLAAGLILLVMLFIFPSAAYAALSIDEDEYDLYVDEYPDDISINVYAKFAKNKADPENYYINLTEATEAFNDALSKAGISTGADQKTCGFTSSLWYMDPEGEKDDAKKTDSTVIYCPIPDDAQEHPKDCKLYSVASGKAKPVNTAFETSDDDTVYVKLSAYGTYGFVYKDPETYEDDESDDEDDGSGDEDDSGDDDSDFDPDDDSDGDGDDDSDFDPDDDFDDEDDGDFDDEDDFDDDEFDDDSFDSDDDFGDDDDDFYYDDSEYYYDDGAIDTASDSDEATPTPTPAVKKDTSGNAGSTSSAEKTGGTKSQDGQAAGQAMNKSKDSIPKTGDSFPLGTVILLSCILAVISLTSFTVYFFRRKQNNK